jgi:hypothetical protein
MESQQAPNEFDLGKWLDSLPDPLKSVRERLEQATAEYRSEYDKVRAAYGLNKDIEWPPCPACRGKIGSIYSTFGTTLYCEDCHGQFNFPAFENEVYELLTGRRFVTKPELAEIRAAAQKRQNAARKRRKREKKGHK